MIRAILWDFGGVITSSPFEAFNRLEKERGAPLDLIRRVNATNPDNNAWALFESDRITLDEFDELFARESSAAGHEIRGKDVINVLAGDIRPRMVAVLKFCRRHLRVGCITNNVRAGHGPGMTQDDATAASVADIMSIFDVVIESSEEGVRKPDPRIYQIACERMRIDPTETIFLDDLGINLKPARAMGMQTIKVINEGQAISELAALTGLDLESIHA